MYLHFETQAPEGKDNGMPILVEQERITPDIEVATGVIIDGAEVGLETEVIASFQSAVGRFNAESLPHKHFRDCTHLAMAMCGLYMPTHRVFDDAYNMVILCGDQVNASEHLGPTALGIPNDDRCLGFGPVPFVYSHAVFGVESSMGTLCFSKVGVRPEYSLSTFEVALTDWDLEVVHPIDRLSVVSAGAEVFNWSRRA